MLIIYIRKIEYEYNICYENKSTKVVRDTINQFLYFLHMHAAALATRGGVYFFLSYLFEKRIGVRLGRGHKQDYGLDSRSFQKKGYDIVCLTCNVSLGNGEQRKGKNESRESSENATSVIQVTVETGLDQETGGNMRRNVFFVKGRESR